MRRFEIGIRFLAAALLFLSVISGCDKPAEPPPAAPPGKVRSGGGERKPESTEQPGGGERKPERPKSSGGGERTGGRHSRFGGHSGWIGSGRNGGPGRAGRFLPRALRAADRAELDGTQNIV